MVAFDITHIQLFKILVNKHKWCLTLKDRRDNYIQWDTFKIHMRQNPPAFKIHPVKFENRLPIEGKGQG